MSEYLWQRHEALKLVLSSAPIAQSEAPYRLQSKANAGHGESRTAAIINSQRIKGQRGLGLLLGSPFKRHVSSSLAMNCFFTVLLTRVAPHQLDANGNLEHAFKSIQDGIAQALGVDDRDPLVRYVVDQERGKPKQYAVRAQLFVSGDRK